mmetsp:Transcript_13609/g.42965  ORF Transcript_13609/g.42965 Transcript_13609/m.42965 type:complete len:421 (-) Transcript_13609:134-1396(-)
MGPTTVIAGQKGSLRKKLAVQGSGGGRGGGRSGVAGVQRSKKHDRGESLSLALALSLPLWFGRRKGGRSPSSRESARVVLGGGRVGDLVAPGGLLRGGGLADGGGVVEASLGGENAREARLVVQRRGGFVVGTSGEVGVEDGVAAECLDEVLGGLGVAEGGIDGHRLLEVLPGGGLVVVFEEEGIVEVGRGVAGVGLDRGEVVSLGPLEVFLGFEEDPEVGVGEGVLRVAANGLPVVLLGAVVVTLVFLEEKGEVIVGQGVVRTTPNRDAVVVLRRRVVVGVRAAQVPKVVVRRRVVRIKSERLAVALRRGAVVPLPLLLLRDPEVRLRLVRHVRLGGPLRLPGRLLHAGQVQAPIPAPDRLTRIHQRDAPARLHRARRRRRRLGVHHRLQARDEWAFPFQSDPSTGLYFLVNTPRFALS